MRKKEIKKQLEEYFVNEVANINKIIKDEEEKDILFNYLKTYTIFLAKRLGIELEI